MISKLIKVIVIIILAITAQPYLGIKRDCPYSITADGPLSTVQLLVANKSRLLGSSESRTTVPKQQSNWSAASRRNYILISPIKYSAEMRLMLTLFDK